MNLDLVILSPEGVVYEGEVLSLYVPSEKGPLGILPGYTPTIAPLRDGVGKALDALKKTAFYFVCFGGALEVKPDGVVVSSPEARLFPKEEEAVEALKKGRSTPSSQSLEVQRATAALTSTYAESKK
jgi:F0F1-type ATP synthase epsilon subunit